MARQISILQIPKVMEESVEIFDTTRVFAPVVNCAYITTPVIPIPCCPLVCLIACYLDPDLRKMIFGVVIGGIIPLFFIPIFERFVVKSKDTFLDETKEETKKS